jgi:predicted enzyme related to lactoylglutathione lyase
MPTAQETATSTIAWFEIPATDFARAIQFYETILGSPLIHQAAWPNLAIFPYEKPGISGAIAYGDGFKPTGDGIVIYLNCDGKFDTVLNRVEDAGGAIVEPKNHLSSVGWVAQIRDTEGNRIGLHATA